LAVANPSDIPRYCGRSLLIGNSKYHSVHSGIDDISCSVTLHTICLELIKLMTGVCIRIT